MKLSEKQRQQALADGVLISVGGRLFIALDVLADTAKLASEKDEPTAAEPKGKADGKGQSA